MAAEVGGAAALEAGAELTKLSRLLAVEPGELAYLEALPPATLRELRDAITERLFSADAHRLRRMAKASTRLPDAVVAKIGEHAFGPLLCARVAGLLETGRAVGLAGRLPSAFLADVAVELDPRRASEVIAKISADRIGEVGAILAERGEFIVMGSFVGHLEPATIPVAIEAIDDVAVLEVAFALDNKERLDEIVDVIGDARLERVIGAATDRGMWPQTLDMIGHLGASNRERFAGLAAIRKPEALDAILETAAAQSLWAELLPLVTLLPADEQCHVARGAGRMPERAREQLAACAQELGLIEELGELGELAGLELS